MLDRDLGVIAVTDALVQRSGHVFDDLVGKNALELVHPGDRYRAQVAWGPLEGDSKIQGESLLPAARSQRIRGVRHSNSQGSS